MSVSGLITYGIGPGGSLQLLLLDGLYTGAAGPAPVPVAIGGMVKKRHSKRYEVMVDGVLLIGRSLPDLERKVAAWRAAHPKAQPQPEKPPAPRQDALPQASPDEASLPDRIEEPETGPEPVQTAPQPLIIAPALLAAMQITLAQAAAMRQEELEARIRAAEAQMAAEAHRQALEMDDLEALHHILEVAA